MGDIMTRRHGKKGDVGKFKEELDDVLISIRKKARASLVKERRINMKLTEDWAKAYGKGKPRWTPYLYSSHKGIVHLLRAYWSYFGLATKIKKRRNRKGITEYHLEIYDHTSRRLR
jgi:hypothetical protein